MSRQDLSYLEGLDSLQTSEMSEETKTGISGVSVTVLGEDIHFFSHTSDFPHI